MIRNCVSQKGYRPINYSNCSSPSLARIARLLPSQAHFPDLTLPPPPSCATLPYLYVLQGSLMLALIFWFLPSGSLSSSLRSSGLGHLGPGTLSYPFRVHLAYLNSRPSIMYRMYMIV